MSGSGSRSPRRSGILDRGEEGEEVGESGDEWDDSEASRSCSWSADGRESFLFFREDVLKASCAGSSGAAAMCFYLRAVWPRAFGPFVLTFGAAVESVEVKAAVGETVNVTRRLTSRVPHHTTGDGIVRRSSSLSSVGRWRAWNV